MNEVYPTHQPMSPVRSTKRWLLQQWQRGRSRSLELLEVQRKKNWRVRFRTDCLQVFREFKGNLIRKIFAQFHRWDSVRQSKCTRCLSTLSCSSVEENPSKCQDCSNTAFALFTTRFLLLFQSHFCENCFFTRRYNVFIPFGAILEAVYFTSRIESEPTENGDLSEINTSLCIRGITASNAPRDLGVLDLPLWEEAKCLWTPYTHLFFRDWQNLLFLSWLPTDDGVEHRNVLKSKLLPLPPDLSNHL